MDEKFPEFKFTGSPFEIGFEHGKLMRSKIRKSLEFYKKIWQAEDEVILETVIPFKEAIKENFPELGEEIEGIAEGAEIDDLWIYALNSRTEILAKFRSQAPNECTAAYFAESRLLAQNWDWAQELEDLVFLMRIEYGDKSILQLTEPGIIGKIGFNTYGLGVCLNLLKTGKDAWGVPIHVLLRVVLECSSISEVEEKLEKVKFGKSSNMLIGDSRGNYLSLEFAAENVYSARLTDKYMVHTNHYLRVDINKDPVEFASSFSRYGRATEIIEELPKTIQGMKDLLGDQKRTDLPICRPYVEDELIGNVGTVTSIIMDLPNREMHITKGNPFQNQYVTIYLK